MSQEARERRRRLSHAHDICAKPLRRRPPTAVTAMLAGSEVAVAPAVAAVLMTDCCTITKPSQRTCITSQPQHAQIHCLGVYLSLLQGCRSAGCLAATIAPGTDKAQDPARKSSAQDSHLHCCLLRCSLCSVGLQLLKDLAHGVASSVAGGGREAVAVLLVGIHGCQVIELCAVQSTQVLVVAL